MTGSGSRRAPLACVLALAALSFGSCATNHVLNWSVEEPSLYKQNSDPRVRSFLNSGGAVAALPAAIVWDVVTFPFQWIWGVYPFGDQMNPESVQIE